MRYWNSPIFMDFKNIKQLADDIYSYISSRFVEEMGGITGIFQHFVQNFLFPF